MKDDCDQDQRFGIGGVHHTGYIRNREMGVSLRISGERIQGGRRRVHTVAYDLLAGMEDYQLFI